MSTILMTKGVFLFKNTFYNRTTDIYLFVALEFSFLPELEKDQVSIRVNLYGVNVELRRWLALPLL